MALAGYDTGALSTYTDALCAEPRLVGLRDIMRVETDTALADTAARVSVTLRNNETLHGEFDLDRPMAPAARETKIRAKAASLLERASADAFWGVVDDLDQRPVTELARLLAG